MRIARSQMLRNTGTDHVTDLVCWACPPGRRRRTLPIIWMFPGWNAECCQRHRCASGGRVGGNGVRPVEGRFTLSGISLAGWRRGL